MRAESQPRQTSLRAFFGYLTLVCVLLGIGRATNGFDTPPPLGLFLSVALFSSFGAALGSLFGRAAIGALPLPFREVLLLSDVEELSYREIAEMLSIPIGTVTSRLLRARRKVRDAIGTSVMRGAV